MNQLQKSNKTEIWLLNVERGLACLVKTRHDDIIIYDLGSTADFSPLTNYIKSRAFSKLGTKDKVIDQVFISHPHLDHMSDLSDENTEYLKTNVSYITCQNDKTDGQTPGHAINFDRVNNQKSGAGTVANYKSLYEGRNLPLQSFVSPNGQTVPNLRIGYYYITHKQADALFEKSDQDYTNSLSIVLYVSHGPNSILFTGDVTPEALDLMLQGKCEKRFTDYSATQSDETKKLWATTTCDQPSLRSLLKKGLSLLVAPHHGLESGYSQELFDVIGDNLPSLIIISEKRRNGKTEGNTHANYQNGTCSTGMTFGGRKRYSISTVNDGHIKVVFDGTSGSVRATPNFEDLF